MLHIQDPVYKNSLLLHEALLQSSIGAIAGAGAYAFVSYDGVQLLFQDKTFVKFLKTGHFDLIVGMDEITNTRTLSILTSLKQKYRNHISIRAFLHQTKGSTFHPKFSWFKTNDGGYLVVGSGNLTQKGLRQNREAYIVEKINTAQMDAIIKEWASWLADNSENLKPLDSPEVIERAKENELKRISKHSSTTNSRRAKAGPREKAAILYDEPGAWEIETDSQVLLAEIPGGTNSRWGQANFSKDIFRTYFGAQPNGKEEYRIILRSVNWDSSLGSIENRPAVSVKSNNYRFELSQAK